MGMTCRVRVTVRGTAVSSEVLSYPTLGIYKQGFSRMAQKKDQERSGEEPNKEEVAFAAMS